MAKKISLIGFVKAKHKSVKFNANKEQLRPEDFIKFYYGVSADKPIIGKVTKVLSKGVEVYTDYGWMNVLWERIDRVFKVKTSGKLKETKLLSVDGSSPLPLIDAAIDRIIVQVKNENIPIKLKDKRLNKTTSYSRHLELKGKSGVITIEVQTKDDSEALIKGLKRKAVIKLNNKGKISSSIIKKVVEGAKKLIKPAKKGSPLNITSL